MDLALDGEEPRLALEHRVELERLEQDAEGAVLDALEVEEVVDERAEPLRLLDDDLQRLVPRLLVDAGVARHLGVADHRRQRGAQLMGDRLDQAGLQRLGGALDRDVAQNGHPADQPAVLVEDARRAPVEAVAGRVRDLVLPFVEERSRIPVPEHFTESHVRGVLQQSLTARPDHLDRIGGRVENGAVEPGKPGELATTARELHEHRHLRAQDVRVVGLHQVVDRPHFVAPDDLLDPVAAGREKDDRRLVRPLASANRVRELDPVHDRHADVEEDDRELLLSDEAKCFRATRRARQVVAERLEHELERDQVGRTVVDQQD